MPGPVQKFFRHPASPYVTPFAAFLLLTALAGGAASRELHALAFGLYALKTAVAAGLLLFYRKRYDELRWSFSFPAVAVGLLVCLVWVVPEDILRPTMLGSDRAFDPYRWGHGTAAAFVLSIRWGGSSIVVPIMEELFWRSFLIRYIARPEDFRSVPVGTLTWPSFVVTTVLFGIEHDRWIVGLVAGASYNALLYWKKNLSACVLAHAITNFALGSYIVATGKYEFW
ncbi:MAG: CAAX prenyl protease-related protein [Vicinamibacteria bacterium]